MQMVIVLMYVHQCNSYSQYDSSTDKHHAIYNYFYSGNLIKKILAKMSKYKLNHLYLVSFFMRL